MALIEINNVSVSFPGVKALDEVSFSVSSGEVIALCGENGAGKSTIGKVLAGVIPARAYTGEVRKHGRLLTNNSTLEASAEGIVIVHQELNLFGELSVAENMFIDALPTKGGVVDYVALYRRSREVLERLGVAIDPQTPVKELTVSGQQLVEIAKALAKNPEVIVFDEATSSLSGPEVEALFGIIRTLQQQGIAILYVSHKLDEIFEICTRVVVLKDGKFVKTSPTELTNQSEVVSWMVGRDVNDLYPTRDEAFEYTGAYALEVKNWSVKAALSGQRNLVTNVSFGVERGEILGVYGLVGAGRTELLRSIFEGAENKENASGELYVNGVHTRISHPQQAIAAGLGLVTEDRKQDGLVFTQDVLRNLTLASLKNLSGSTGVINTVTELTAAQRMSERLRIKVPNIFHGVSKLSGGNQQKVILGKWLLTKPKVLILDEPTRGVDVGAKAEIYKIMHELSQQGVSIVMISSELPEIIGLSDRIIVLREGNLQGEVLRAEATEEHLARLAMTSLPGPGAERA